MTRTLAAPPAAPLDAVGVQHLMGYRLALAELASRRVFQRHIGTPFELRPVEFTLLVLLLTNASATPKQLTQTLGVSPPNLTVLVDRLVQRGLVARQRSTTDGRATILRLTDTGAALARRAQRVSLTMEAGLLTPLTAGERAMLAELLSKLVHGAGATGPA